MVVVGGTGGADAGGADAEAAFLPREDFGGSGSATTCFFPGGLADGSWKR